MELNIRVSIKILLIKCNIPCQDVDAATAGRIALEKQLENLEIEMEFLQRIHKQVRLVRTHALSGFIC